MTEKYVLRALPKLDTGSHRQIFNILVEIRTKVMKSKNGVFLLIKHGLVPRLLSLLSSRDGDVEAGKMTDIILSILGNLCMDENARRQVMAHDGISKIVEIFCESESHSIQNRCCRTLANLSLSQDCSTCLHKTSLVARIVQLLQDKPITENRLTYCRALRLLGTTPSNLEKLENQDSVRYVAWLLKEEEKDLQNAGLRTLYEFSSLRCTAAFANQVNNAGVIPCLVDWLSHNSTEISHQAITVLLRLLEHSHIRSSFGGAGGISLLINIINKDEIIEKLNRFSALNILCMCSKEVVNRVKIRENGGLTMFLTFLEDKDYCRLHDRIISALQCYLYDDEGFDILLRNGIVAILTKHLQRVARFETTLTVFCTADISVNNAVSDESVSDKELRKNETSEQNLNQKDNSRRTQNDSGPDFVSSDKHVYSIDSPTYQATSQWNLDDYRTGVKCKQFFDTEASSSSSQMAYSPLSTISYYSPRSSLNGSDYSPCHSPVSPSLSSEINNDPNYPFVCSVPYSRSTPEKQDNSSIMGSSQGYSPDHGEYQNINCYSEDEESEEEDDKKSSLYVTVKANSKCYRNDDVSGNSSSDVRSLKDTLKPASSVDITTTGDLEAKMTVNSEEDRESIEDNVFPMKEKDDQSFSTIRKINQSKKKKLPNTEDSDEKDNEMHRPSKRRKLKTLPRNVESAVENHILIIFSRISQKLDTSKHLVTMETVCCLLDYIATVKQAESRAVRIVSRLVRNPQSFEKFLQMNFPWIVYNKLLSVVKNDETWTFFLKNGIFSFTDNMRTLSTSSVSSCNSVTDVDTSVSESSDVTDTETLSDSEKYMTSSENDGSETVIAGMTLLQDLCLMADAPFGRGVIGHLLATEDEHKQICCAIGLLYICWNRSMWKHYFVKLNILDKLLEHLQRGPSETPYFNHILEGFAVLGKLTNFNLKLKVSNLRHYFQEISSEHREDSKACRCRDVSEDDVVWFVIKRGGPSVKANRQTLSRSSLLFTAMLDGHYAESKQKEILLKDTSLYAVTYVLHFLHDCDTNCEIIDDLVTCEINSQTLSQCLEVLSLANKYLVSSLQQYLLRVVSTRFLVPLYASNIYSFCLLHGFQDLLEDSVRASLVNGRSVQERMRGIENFILGPNSQLYIQDIKRLFQS